MSLNIILAQDNWTYKKPSQFKALSLYRVNTIDFSNKFYYFSLFFAFTFYLLFFQKHTARKHETRLLTVIP